MAEYASEDDAIESRQDQGGVLHTFIDPELNVLGTQKEGMPPQKIRPRFGADAGTSGSFLENHGHGLSRERFGRRCGMDVGIAGGIRGLEFLGQVEEASEFGVAVRIGSCVSV